MKIKIILILLSTLLTTAANAQTSWTNTLGLATLSTCSGNGETWEELGMVCHAEKMFRLTPQTVTAIGSNITITGTSQPKCDGDYQLVMTSAGTPMCARDLREPTR